MRIGYFVLIAAALAWMTVPRLAAASVIYTYTGNPYDRFETEGIPPPNPYDLGMSVSAQFVLDTPVGPNRTVDPTFFSSYSWSIFDGTITLDQSNTTSVAFSLGTDENGVINSWYFFATSDPLVDPGDTYHLISSAFDAGPFRLDGDVGNTSNCIEFSSTSGACSNSNRISAFADTPGNWTVSPVPLPGAAWLFASALAGLVILRRRRRA